MQRARPRGRFCCLTSKAPSCILHTNCSEAAAPGDTLGLGADFHQKYNPASHGTKIKNENAEPEKQKPDLQGTSGGADRAHNLPRRNSIMRTADGVLKISIRSIAPLSSSISTALKGGAAALNQSTRPTGVSGAPLLVRWGARGAERPARGLSGIVAARRATMRRRRVLSVS